MANILICVPSTREYEPFLESFQKFVKDVQSKHTIIVFWAKDRRLVDIQNEAVEKLLAGNFDYLLFLDDDHSGHSIAMLDTLIEANAYMATIKSYIRHYPYMCALLKRLKNGLYVGIEDGSGYMPVDATGFPMTLIRKDLFTKLEKPYFRECVEGNRSWATDGEFCSRLDTLGIKPIGCFQHCLPHGDITNENILSKRLEDGISTDNQMLNFIYDHYKGENLCLAKQ